MRRAIWIGGDPRASHGLIDGRRFAVTYETSQPDPSHWVAVGTLWNSDKIGPDWRPLGMLVGAGRSERGAIVHLGCRLAELEESLARDQRVATCSRPGCDRLIDVFEMASP